MGRAKHAKFEDLDAVRGFLQSAGRVEQTTMVRDAVGTKFQVSWRRGETWRFTSTEPSEDVLLALLTHLRPIVVLGESINLRSIFTICEQRLTSDDHRRALREGQVAWKRAQRDGMMALRIGERDMPPDYVMRLWIGWYYHPTGKDATELASLLPLGQVLSRQVFLDHVYRAIECVIWTASVLEDAIDRRYFS